ncbi:MAG TPA: hypothetical protein P5056_01155 [Candidatus Paceibacterota bacterium]|nr:hypothetical protein [Candidatus Paceibacterota bacterium]
MIQEILVQLLQTFGEVLFRAFAFALPFLAFIIAWSLWRYYIVRNFIAKAEWVMLEVKLPKEHQKTPQAMEVVLGAFHQFPTPPTWYDYWWLGKVPLWFSLELVSINGAVHFFMKIQKSQRSIIENHIYSQYPQAEIHQVPDYVGGINFEAPDSKWKMFGMEHVLVREDAYPIKTYVDYGLDRELLKEEQKVDPITSTIEFLGSLGEDEQAWIQIIIMAAQPRFPKKDTWFGKEDWKGNAKELLKKLLKRDAAPGFGPMMMLSPGERATVEAIERSMSKLGFDCGIRTLYFGKDKKFNPQNIANLFATFRQYGSVTLNSFKPVRITSFNWWVDPFGWKLKELKSSLFRAYVSRGYFYRPFKNVPPFTLNSEELATIYHFPGAVSVTPTFSRIESKRAEAPINLPI